MTDISRFWGKTAVVGLCIEWKAGRAKNGYGLFSIRTPRGSKRRHRTVYAHRFIYECVLGALPPKADAMHSCDNRACVSLQHLSPGSRKFNMIDAANKGRTEHGVARQFAKLTEDKVREARRRYAEGESQAQIAKDFGVHQVTIGKAITGKTWRHVK